MQAFCETSELAPSSSRRGGRPAHGQSPCQGAHGRRSAADRSLSQRADAESHPARGRPRPREAAWRSRRTRAILRRRHQGHRRRAHERHRALSRTDGAGHQRISRRCLSAFWISSVTSRTLYTGDGSDPLGRVLAFVGAKGGVGASTVAHNVAWSIARELEIQTVIVDMDLAYRHRRARLQPGPAAGHSRCGLRARSARRQHDRQAPVEMHGSSQHARRVGDAGSDLRFRRKRLRYDLRHSAGERSLHRRRHAARLDGVVEAQCSRRGRCRGRRVARSREPAELERACSTSCALRGRTTTSRELVLNNVGMLKRPEIELADFATAVETDPIGVIPFDAKLFGTATNNGQMVAEVESGEQDHRSPRGDLAAS